MKNMDLSNLGEGAVAERIDIEVRKVLENIMDPNTDPKKARKLQITLTFKADEKRDLANVTVQTKTTVVPAREVETRIVMDRDAQGAAVGRELMSGQRGQTYMDDSGQVRDDVGDPVDERKVVTGKFK